MTYEQGAVYWCILPDIESSNHGDTCPSFPWQGKLHTEKHPSGPIWLLSCFNEDSDEIDYNINATSIIADPAQLFATEEDARLAYVAEMVHYLGVRAEELYRDLEHLQRFIAKGSTEGKEETAGP